MSAPTEQEQTVAPPLALFPTPQRGRFTDAERAGIAARIAYARLPWWERWLAPRPPTWEQTTDPYR